MPSSFTFNEGAFLGALSRLRDGIEEAAREGMEEVMSRAEMDAQAIARWREEGTYSKSYPSGDWTWTVTDMARSSITAYVVPNKRLKRLPTFETISTWNGIPLRHEHRTDDSVTGNHSASANVVVGVVTMNVAYAPYLQEHEMELASYPVTVEVLEMNWSRVYVPTVLRPIMERVMARFSTV